MTWHFASFAFLARSMVACTATAPSARRHLATLTLAACAAAVHGIAQADEAVSCPDMSNGNGLMPDEVNSAWQCDVAETIAVPTAPVPGSTSDARLMLIVGVSSGAGWLARGLHKE